MAAPSHSGSSKGFRLALDSLFRDHLFNSATTHNQQMYVEKELGIHRTAHGQRIKEGNGRTLIPVQDIDKVGNEAHSR